MFFIRLKNFIFNLTKYNFFYYKTRLFGSYFINNEYTELSQKIDDYKKLLIYGFGPYGEEYFVKLFYKNKIIGICDINYELLNEHIMSPCTIKDISFDYVIVTVMDEKARKVVINNLLGMGISYEKIVLINYK